MKGYLRYERHTDSEVDWVKEIPSNWITGPLCSFATLKSIKNCPGRELLSVYLEMGVVKFSDVNEKRTNATSEDITKYQAVDVGDLVLNNQQAWRGSVGVSSYSGIVSPAYLVLSIRNLNHRFANYVFRNCSMVSNYLICSRGVGTIQRNLYWSNLKRVRLAVPPMDEQNQIADFLNQKTQHIGQAIAQKERLIKLLQERQRILIHNAVTRGLDPNVKMKDSGVEWIGEIPDHWQVKPLRHLGKCQNGISEGAEYFGKGFPFVSYTDVYKNYELPAEVEGLASSTKTDRELYSVVEGDVLFTRTSETIGEIGLTSVCSKTIKDSTFSGFLIRFRPFPNVLLSGFSKFYFRDYMHRAFFVKEMNLVIRASLSQELLKRLPVLVLPLSEQREIAAYLESISKSIQSAIERTIEQIDRLKEYKAVLIDSAVTGKIKVT